LVSWAGLTFTGSGAISGVKSAWPVSFDGEYDCSLINMGQTFPFDAQGIEAAPYKGTPTITYEYILLGSGASDALQFKDVRQKWNTIYSRLQGTYTWGSIAGTSGQKGTLVVADEDPTVMTTYSATARILKPAPWTLTKGQPGELIVQLSFALLSDFS
jgi:hypothetical protein